MLKKRLKLLEYQVWIYRIRIKHNIGSLTKPVDILNKLLSNYIFTGSCASNYFLAGTGNQCSALKGEKIETSKECSDAANRIGKKFGQIVDISNRPSGCYVYQSTNDAGSFAFFNVNAGIPSSKFANPVCKKNWGMKHSYNKHSTWYFKIRLMH